MIEALIFALAAYSAVGYDGKPCELPLDHGAVLWRVANHHGEDPALVAGYLCAEHKGRDWSPDLEGRYGKRDEIGAGQLKPVWATRAEVRCSRERDYYEGEPDCLFIEPGAQVVRRPTPRQRSRGVLGLDDWRVNLEATVIAHQYTRRFLTRSKIHLRALDHRAYLRCTVWLAQHKPSQCLRSVNRYLEWEMDVAAQHEHIREQVERRSRWWRRGGDDA